MNILVTGAAGFIGMHTSERLLQQGHHVLGLDSFSPYYDVGLKRDRASLLLQHPNFQLLEADINRPDVLAAIEKTMKPQRVVHLAAQVGVRHSILQPMDYASANLTGFLQVLEWSRRWRVEHLVYASSSSVYGGNRIVPFAESHPVDHPISLYAATKKSNELMAHSYSHLYGLPTTGLRFFTVYGPWGRPDMAAWGFTRAIAAGEPIEVFNHGRMVRDFTYVDDVVDSVLAVLYRPAEPIETGSTATGPDTSTAPYRIFNVGNANPVQLDVFIQAIEQALGKSAIRINREIQAGDVEVTAADTSSLQAWTGQSPGTDLHVGVKRFVDWYVQRYGVQNM
jgi:UDP-glucuronate 4-epimerase